ncbi:MAG TPA: hypothetical protein VJ521_06995, partial [Acidobacteriota bacterium]|nr:hypothetical protein [Acidobacteriota bacterium]
SQPENRLKMPQNPQRQVHPRRWWAIILYERNKGAMLKVYSEVASTQAVQSNGDALKKASPALHRGFRSN